MASIRSSFIETTRRVRKNPNKRLLLKSTFYGFYVMKFGSDAFECILSVLLTLDQTEYISKSSRPNL